MPEPAHQAILRDSYVFNWDKQTFRTDLIFVPAMAICLGVGIAVGHAAAGMIAAGGAMTVGLGAKQEIDHSRLLPMIFAALGMSFATFVGMVAGHTNYAMVALAASWGFGYGMLTTREPGYAWVGQQCVITLLVASAFPFSADDALVRASLILAGGVTQIVISSLLLGMLRQLHTDLSRLTVYFREEQIALRTTLEQAALSVTERDLSLSALPYGLRLAITLGVSTEIYRRLHFASGYWIPMTALLVLKPGLTDTVSRAIARTVGTVLGAILASFFIAHLVPSPVVLAAGTVLFAWLAYGTLNVNYATFTLFLTSYIVFLLSLTGVTGAEIAYRRTVCTIIGGSLALLLRLLVLRRRRMRVRQSSPAAA